MFSRNQFFNENYIQQSRVNHFNTGMPYYPAPQIPDYPAQYPNPYYQQPYVGLTGQPPMMNNWNNMQQYPNQNPYPTSYIGNKGNAQSIFHNPLESDEYYGPQMQMPYQPMNYNPYPKPNMIPKPNGGIGTIMNSFKGQDGSFDLNKMMNTAGQMMNAVSQVSSMVKGLGGIFKV